MIVKPASGAIKKKKRVGRGPGSGMGKTCTRGQNGQKSRKGGGVRVGFEGGQTPLYRRIPKKGFKNFKFRKNYNEVNLFILEKLDNDTVVDFDKLKDLGFIKSVNDKIKVLSNGTLTKKLEVHADKFSKKAIEKIEAVGGKAVIRN